jgi:lysozyme family protein
MSEVTFGGALARVLAHEGGFTDDPRDPGGATNYGITLADYRRYVKPDAAPADVRVMRIGEARRIYRAHYWDALGCDALPAGIDECVFDYGVNSGVGRAGKVLRRVLGLPDDDWRVTEQVAATCADREAAAVVNAICDERLRFLKSLRTWPAFGKGWRRRVAEVRASALALAANPAPQIPAE